MTTNKIVLLAIPFLFVALVGADNCSGGAAGEARRAETLAMGENQSRLNRVQPAPQFDYSLQRDVLSQIYVATNDTRPTYTVVESVTGTPRWTCASIGYAIPADTSLTNPLQGIRISGNGGSGVVEQAEPNGLYSSKNTDGTWVLCVEDSGTIAPRYTEHKVTTFPYAVVLKDGMWERAEGETSAISIDLSRAH